MSRKENTSQDRRFFSRKMFSLLGNSDFSINFFDESGMFPAVQGNINKANTISNGSFLLEGIGLGCYVSTSNLSNAHIKPVLTFNEINSYNSLIQNSIIRIQEANKLIYECPLIDILNPIVAFNTTTNPVVSQIEYALPNCFYNKLRINTPYLLRQEQTFLFSVIGRNLTTNTGDFILYGEIMGRFQFAQNYGAN